MLATSVLEAVDFRAASPPLRFRLHQNVVISLVAIPPTCLEAADKNFRFRFQTLLAIFLFNGHS